VRAIAVVLLALPATAGGASFDCTKAATSVEKLICGSAELSALDSRMAKRYGDAVRRSVNAPALRRQQRDWLRDVRDRCKDEACISDAYLRRAQRFEWTTTLGQENALCEDLRAQMNRRGGLSAHVVPEEESNQGDVTHAIRGADVDGDKIEDRLSLFRTGSASLIPPDNSAFFMTLSSNGTEHRQDAGRLSVIRYQLLYYLLTGDFAGEEGPVKSEVHRLERAGIRTVCSYECGLPDGACATEQ
jgi:uncharacterized protein YecT (DUF1311 family)